MKPGSLRYKGKNGEWIVAQPGEPLFSTVTMVAEEFWDGKEWKNMYNEEKNDGEVSI